MGLWTGSEESAKRSGDAATRRPTGKPSAKTGPGWVSSFDAFVKNVAGPEGIRFDRD